MSATVIQTGEGDFVHVEGATNEHGSWRLGLSIAGDTDEGGRAWVTVLLTPNEARDLAAEIAARLDR